MINSNKYIQTGIPGFDELADRGFLKGSTITLSGPTGCGKSTFAMQFLVEGAKKYNEPGLYISLEDSKDTILAHMDRFNWKLEEMEAKKQLFFLDYPVYEVGQFLEKENAIGEIINTMGIERVVIDSIMPIALSFKTADERRSQLMNLLTNIRRWKTTTMVVSEDTNANPNDILPRTNYEFEKLSDGWVHISYYKDNEGNRKRAVEILKMKGTHHVMKSFDLELTDKGFNVLSKLNKKSKK